MTDNAIQGWGALSSENMLHPLMALSARAYYITSEVALELLPLQPWKVVPNPVRFWGRGGLVDDRLIERSEKVGRFLR